MIWICILITFIVTILLIASIFKQNQLAASNKTINSKYIDLQRRGLEIEGQIEEIKDEIALVSELYSASDKLIHLEDEKDVYHQVFLNINSFFNPNRFILFSYDEDNDVYVNVYANDNTVSYPNIIKSRDMKVKEYFNANGVSMIVKNSKDKPLFYIKMENKTIKMDNEYMTSVFTNTDYNIFNLYVTQVGMVLDKIKDYKKMRKMALTDNLTGLYNRHYAHMRIKQEAKRASREGYPISILFVDIDKFKSVNDTFGHDIGDLALKHVSKLIQQNSREYDVAIRWGGEEFVLFLPNTTAEGAFILAERLRICIEQSNFEYCKLTTSLGIATYPNDNINIEKVTSYADEALYYSKQSGRNRTTLYNDVKHLINND